MKQPDELFSIRDIIDSQLETADHIPIGRVADIELEVGEDNTLILKNLLTGPQALAGRISPRLLAFLRLLLRDRFEAQIPLSEVVSFGPTLQLRKEAREYPVGDAERWIVRYILRWIPGSGYRWRPE